METTQENTPTLALPPRDLMRENANALAKEINWFAQVVNQRLESVFPKESIPKPTPVVVEKKGFNAMKINLASSAESSAGTGL